MNLPFSVVIHNLILLRWERMKNVSLNITFLWLLSCMDLHVSEQGTTTTKLPATHTTHKLLLSSMHSLYVCLEVPLLRKCFSTLTTFVLSLSCMDPHVCDQAAFQTKLPATHTTHKLFLSSVYSLYVCSEVYLL